MFILAILGAAHLAASDGDTTLHLARSGAVEVNTQNRDVAIRVGTTDVVTVRGGSVDADGGTISIDGDRGRGTVEVTLPSWARLDVSTIGGSLTFNGTPDRTHAETINGTIRVDNGTGRLDLESVAGAITVNGFKGSRLSIDATNEGVSVTNVTGELRVDGVNGGIAMHGIHSTSVSAETVNGSVEYAGEFAATGSYAFSTQNQNVTLIVGADFSARVRLTTMNGTFQSPDLPARTNGAVVPDTKGGKHGHTDDGEHTLTAVFGNGDARVSVDAFNGNVIVRKAGAHE